MSMVLMNHSLRQELFSTLPEVERLLQFGLDYFDKLCGLTHFDMIDFLKLVELCRIPSILVCWKICENMMSH